MVAKFVFRIFFVILLLVLASCANQNSDPNKPITVKITADEFSYQSSITTFSVGQKYRFEVTNVGKIPHEIMVIQPIQPGVMDMEAMDELALAHIPEDDLLAGTTLTMDYTFTEPAPSGELEFACHIQGHYEGGMKLTIVVK